jgi:hypothetical protein
VLENILFSPCASIDISNLSLVMMTVFSFEIYLKTLPVTSPVQKTENNGRGDSLR